MRSNICSGMAVFRMMAGMLGLLLITAAFCTLAYAADKEDAQQSKKVLEPPVKKAVPQEKVKGEELEITVKAPQAYYIMPRSNLNIEGLELNESFIPKIIKSVEEEPF